MKIMKKMILLTFILVGLMYSADKNISILVKPSEGSSNLSKSELTAIKNKIIAEMMKYKDQVNLIDNDDLKNLQEQLYTKGDETTQDDIYSYGQIANADYLCIVSIAKNSSSFSTNYTVDVKLNNAVNGIITGFVTNSGKDLNALLRETTQNLIISFTYETVHMSFNVAPDVAILNEKRIGGNKNITDYAGGGDAHLRIEKGGYRTIDTTWTAVAGQEKSFDFILLPKGAGLHIDGFPLFASIELKGTAGTIKKQGLPFDDHLKAGNYSLSVNAPGFLEFTTNLNIPDGEPLYKRYTLEKYPLNKILISNAILPGLGQIRSGYTLRGVGYSAAAGLSWAGLIYHTLQWIDLKSDYEAALDLRDGELRADDRGGIASDTEQLEKDISTKQGYIWSFASILMLDYSWSMVDAWMQDQKNSKTNLRAGLQIDNQKGQLRAYALLSF